MDEPVNLPECRPVDSNPAVFWTEAPEAATLAAGKGVTVLANGRRIAVLRTESGWRAIDDTCPHRGGPLGSGWIEGDKVYCPLHGWSFNTRTGACEERPQKPLRTYPVEIREGRVFIGL
jgi:nitrite reductase (NADH) small subunit